MIWEVIGHRSQDTVPQVRVITLEKLPECQSEPPRTFRRPQMENNHRKPQGIMAVALGVGAASHNYYGIVVGATHRRIQVQLVELVAESGDRPAADVLGVAHLDPLPTSNSISEDPTFPGSTFRLLSPSSISALVFTVSFLPSPRLPVSAWYFLSRLDEGQLI